jgi:sugar phosphate isomerase/epimerase
VKTLADVTLSFHTLGEVDVYERAEAASAAGFRKLGLSIRRTRAWLDEHSLPELREVLARHGLVVSELEALAPMKVEPDPHADFALELARSLDCPLIQVIGPYDGTAVEAAERLRALADRAPGVTFSLEFLPFTNITTAELGVDLVRAVDRPNVGLCVDFWHLYRSGGSPADLAPLWPHVVSMQLDDGSLVAEDPDLYTDCVHNRRLPGAGEFDVAGLLAQAQRNRPGYSLSIEVISDELTTHPVAERAVLAATTTIAAFERALEVSRA